MPRIPCRVFNDREIRREIKIAGGNQTERAFLKAYFVTSRVVYHWQNWVLHLLEATRNHAGTHNVGRLPRIVLEQGRTPATRQNRIWEHEPRQIQQLAHVVAHAQMLNRKIHHPIGILPRQACGAANAQMFLAVLA